MFRLPSTLTAATLGLLTTVASAQPTPDGFLCCNMRTDGAWISDSNYADSSKRVIPVGTPVQVTGYGRYRVNVVIDGTKQDLGNDYSRSLDMGEFMQRYVVRRDPQRRIAGFPPPVQRAIREAKLRRGMSRDQVLMAIGYPAHNYNPSLDARSWKYWLHRSGAFEVMFDGSGHVSDVMAEPDVRAAVLLR